MADRLTPEERAALASYKGKVERIAPGVSGHGYRWDASKKILVSTSGTGGWRNGGAAKGAGARGGSRGTTRSKKVTLE